jgi:hypothetical protein
MGEKAQAGSLVYTAFEGEWLPQIGQGAAARVPQYRFFLLRVSIVNSGPGDAIAPAFTLVDDSGQTIPELGNGEGVPQWIGYLRNIKPAENTAGLVIFDAAPKHYKLRVTDESGEKAALIDIPLNFGGDTPEMPLPTDLKKR